MDPGITKLRVAKAWKTSGDYEETTSKISCIERNSEGKLKVLDSMV